MQTTIHESKMCRQGTSQKIAMLTDIVENSRQKCAAYFPKEQNDFMIFSSTTNEADNKIIEPFAERLFNNQINNDTSIDTEDDDCDGENHDADDIDEFPQINCNYFLIKNMEIIVKNGYTIRKLCLVYINSSSSSSSTSGNCTSSGSAASGSSSSSIRRHKNNFKVTDVVNIKRMFVYHYWFPDWPDHRSPNDIDVLLDMSLDLLDGQPNSSDEKYAEQHGNNEQIQDTVAVAQQQKDVSGGGANKSFEPLPIIHCSAGIGRTGCLAAILNGLRQMRASSNYTESTAVRTQISVDILGIVCNLRLQRGGMVQNSEQYELIHRALCLYLQRLNSN